MIQNKAPYNFREQHNGTTPAVKLDHSHISPPGIHMHFCSAADLFASCPTSQKTQSHEQYQRGVKLRLNYGLLKSIKGGHKNLPGVIHSVWTEMGSKRASCRNLSSAPPKVSFPCERSFHFLPHSQGSLRISPEFTKF